MSQEFDYAQEYRDTVGHNIQLQAKLERCRAALQGMVDAYDEPSYGDTWQRDYNFEEPLKVARAALKDTE